MTESAQKSNSAKQFMAALPFCHALSMRLETTGECMAEMSMPYDEKLIGDPETGVIHGGAVSALMDTCGGLAVFMHPEIRIPTATIDLRIDYMRAAEPGQRIYTRADVFHATRSVAFVRATAWTTDREKLVATGTGAFTFGKDEKGKG